MACSYCAKSGHNIRTCGNYNARQYVQMLLDNQTESAVCRLIDTACPGAGAACQAISKGYKFLQMNGKHMSKREKERYLMDLVFF